MSRHAQHRAAVSALVLDAIVVTVFAAIGRASHAEGLDVGGVWATAWPFLAALAAGWVAARAWRHPIDVWPTGVLLWAITLVIGMLLRLASGQGTAVAFVVVAALTLALLLVGWRAIATLIASRSRSHMQARSR